jgi:hypothetical protein
VSPKRTHSPKRRLRQPLAVFLVAFVAFFAAIAVWSLATPLMASPDEPVQVSKAAAVVRGELVGHLVGGPSSPTGIVTIPAAYADLGVLVTCYQFNADIAASCAPAYRASAGSVSVPIYDARYPPLYYLIVGLPSLLTDSAVGIYLMRLLSGALSALFLALAVMAAVTWSRSRLLLAGVIVAATPSVLFFAGVVNPSGLETSVAICLWTSALILARERLSSPPSGLVALVSVSAGVEALTRPLSPFWVVLTLVAVLAVADWSGLSSFVRSRAAWLGGAFAAVCGAFGTAWILVEHALNVLPPSAPVPASVGEGRLLVIAFVRTSTYFTEMVSRFGWLVAPSPTVTYITWAGLLGAVFLLALASGSVRRCIVLLALVAAVIVIPMVISVGQAHRIGITWQGKDTLPLAVGVPLLAASMMASSGLSDVRIFRDRFVGVVAAAAGVATLVALFGNVRRDAVGDNGADLSFLHAAWQPPLGIAGVLVFGLLATGLLTLVLMALGVSWEVRSRSAPFSPAPAAGASVTLGAPLEAGEAGRGETGRSDAGRGETGRRNETGQPGETGRRNDTVPPNETQGRDETGQPGETGRPARLVEGGDHG